MSFVIFDAESGIVTGFSENIYDIPHTVYFHDESNDIDFSHTEYDYRELENIPRHIVAYNYKYNDADGFSRIKTAEEILNERKAMLNTMQIRMEKMYQAINDSKSALSSVAEVSDAMCEKSIEDETEREGFVQTLENMFSSITAIEDALCELSKSI